MPGEPFRFLHASQLRLDEPLAGTGPLDSDARRMAEDATLTALENIVDASLAEGVEFVLLTGETFGSGRPTLRARRALLTALENLCEFEIQVFWKVSRDELAGVDVPDNVTPIHSGDADPVAVVRQGRVIASVARARWNETSQPASMDVEREERGAFRVGMASHVEDAVHEAGTYDYLALEATGQRMMRRAAGIAHDPGPAQGTGIDETGIHGATLVRVGAEGAAELTLVPTAPVRRERILVGVERNLSCGQLAERMQSALLELEPSRLEQLWIVHWQIIGNGELFDALQSGAAVEELLATVNRRLATGSDVQRIDRLHFRRRLASYTDELCEQVAAWIRGGDSDPVADVLRELRTHSGPAWLEDVRESLLRVDPARAIDNALRLSQELLLPSAETGTRLEQ